MSGYDPFNLLYPETFFSNLRTRFPLPFPTPSTFLDARDLDNHLFLPLGHLSLPRPLGFSEIIDHLIRMGVHERKYKLTAEIKGPKDEGLGRKYKWTAEVRAAAERELKWTAEIKGKGKDAPWSYSFTVRASADKAKRKDAGLGHGASRAVEIEDSKGRYRAFGQKKTSTERAFDHDEGKRKELSPGDAALLIQTSFRSHLFQRNQTIHVLRDLALAKAKLKEIKALCSNFSYRHLLANDAEERQRFSEKIIVLLLTVDSIESKNPMVRVARKSMVEELEAMLEVVDPQPLGKLSLMRRRKFDLPAVGPISKEMELGVAEVVQMLDQEDTASNLLPEIL